MMKTEVELMREYLHNRKNTHREKNTDFFKELHTDAYIKLSKILDLLKSIYHVIEKIPNNKHNVHTNVDNEIIKKYIMEIDEEINNCKFRDSKIKLFNSDIVGEYNPLTISIETLKLNNLLKNSKDDDNTIERNTIIEPDPLDDDDDEILSNIDNINKTTIIDITHQQTLKDAMYYVGTHIEIHKCKSIRD